MVHFLVRYPWSVYFHCMGNYFFSLVHSLRCLIQSWVNAPKTTLANVGSDESCASMSAVMRLSVCSLFRSHSHVQFLRSPVDVNPEWLCRFWLGVTVDTKPSSTFRPLLMCSWPCVKDHPPSCLPRQFKKKKQPPRLPGEAWRLLRSRRWPDFELNLWQWCFLSAHSHHAHPHTFNGKIFLPRGSWICKSAHRATN